MSETETEIIKPEKPAGSLLDTLRAKRDSLVVEHTTVVEVPGYDGMVGLRLRALTGREQSRLADRTNQSKAPERTTNANADMLVAACDEVVVRENYDTAWHSLAEYDSGDPVGIGERLVDLFKLTPAAPTARETLRSLFALAPSPDLAIVSAANDYIEWARAATEEVDREFVGEPQGAPKSR